MTTPRLTDEEIQVELLIECIMLKHGFDFRNFNRSSLRRRAELLARNHSLPDIISLVPKVLNEPNFVNDLIDGLTVPTTMWFRDPNYFKGIRQFVVPYLRTFPSIKIWVAGCSSGEELYSIAILLLEEGLLEKATIIGTDINTKSLKRAGSGLYRTALVHEAEAAYVASGGSRGLSRHFVECGTFSQISPEIVRRVSFAEHSLATDTAFAETHLISCRNVLIYFNQFLQDRVIDVFRSSLVRGGYLGLGADEALSFNVSADSFREVPGSSRIYQKAVLTSETR